MIRLRASVSQSVARAPCISLEETTWAQTVQCDGPYREALVRSVLALKLLLFSPSGAIAAAATTSLPERIGGSKNYDYRFAWVRDAGYTINAFLRVGAQAEAKAALTWLLKQIEKVRPRVCYSIWGGAASDVRTVDLPGYCRSEPVVAGNRATDQRQHGIYGDIFETAACFVNHGNILDARSAEILAHLADQCADIWRQKGRGIWELAQEQHYTMSKVSCWQALARAVELADAGQLPTTCRDRWSRERDRIEAWITEHCWSESLGAYSFYPGSDRLDASLGLAVRFGFDGRDRLRRTVEAIDRELGCGPYHYRYSGADKEEGCFLACTFWMVEAKILLDQPEAASRAFTEAIDGLAPSIGVYPEMIDPVSGHYLGNMPTKDFWASPRSCWVSVSLTFWLGSSTMPTTLTTGTAVAAAAPRTSKSSTSSPNRSKAATGGPATIVRTGRPTSYLSIIRRGRHPLPASWRRTFSSTSSGS